MPGLTLGCHLSLGRQPRLSIQDAVKHGATCAQIFASSPGAWKLPVNDPIAVEHLRSVLQEFRINPLVIHGIYLINLASDNPSFVERSRASLIATLNYGAAIGASAVITHIGSHGGRGFEAVADEVAHRLVEILDGSDPSIDLLLENSAGAGGILGSTLSELATLLDLAGRPDRLRIALDTAHLCAAGWDFSQPFESARLVAEIERTVGLDRVRILHANDSKVPPGSRRDRHAAIGEGFIGEDGFRNLLLNQHLSQIPWILETPDLDVSLPVGEHMRSLQTIGSLLSEAALSLSP